ncbi:oligosaccharide flippase family protein [Paucibacter sp. TC2R-5]|uniref:oligosaccharide flippase family protein n=1 Tax=Paucibacter sp. TC2R-5 TaxID=2893555 RepID=UPI0021E4473A|nr:oligosaccharide flippase family protein [Paucibacter sp. TC2R-5]MCV2360220.1 oligosaccharide flippase family protein [Paucibacter sp. TC2R-5]
MSLSAKVFAGVKTNYLGIMIRIVGQLAAQVFVMRELGPDLIGTFGYTLLLVGILSLLIDQGFGWSLVQGNFEPEEVAVVFTRLLLGGAICAVFAFCASYPIATYLNNELVGLVIRCSTPSYLLIAFYAISHARLRKDLRFRELQYATTGAYLFSYPVVALGLAWLGAGVWSLLVAWYVQVLLQAFIGNYYAGHSFRLVNPMKPCIAGPMGRDVLGINVLNWGVDNATGAIVSTMGAAQLGNFNAASVLARQPALQLVQTLQVLLFSTATALSNDLLRQRRLFLASLALVSLVVFPVYGFIVAHAGFLVDLLFGKKWSEAAPLLVALSPGMVALALSTVTSSVLTASGFQRAVVKSQAWCLLLSLPMLLIASIYFSVVSVAWVLSAGYVIRLLLQLSTALRIGLASPTDCYQSFRGPLLLLLVAGLPLPEFIGEVLTPLFGTMIWICVLVMIGVFILRILPRFILSPEALLAVAKLGAGRRLLKWLGIDDGAHLS